MAASAQSRTSRTAARGGGKGVIRITATPKKRVPVDLLGVEYMIKPPKTALLLSISSHGAGSDTEPGAVNRDFQTILKLMFTKEDVVDIQERLNDPDDDLDLDHIFETVEAIAEEAAGGDPTL
jgi:hypothetical protein